MLTLSMMSLAITTRGKRSVVTVVMSWFMSAILLTVMARVPSMISRIKVNPIAKRRPIFRLFSMWLLR